MSDGSPDSDRTIFLAKLQAGFEKYHQGGAKKQRTGALQQFSALVSWAERTPGVKERIAPLRHLFYALVGIDTGFRDELLVPPPVGHRPPLSAHKQSHRALAAVAMDFYMRAEESKGSAARLVAHALHGTQGFENITSQQVAKWRESAMTELPTENLAALRFNGVADQLQTMFPNEPREAAEYLIERLKAGYAG
jgi:hypothetical protein